MVGPSQSSVCTAITGIQADGLIEHLQPGSFTGLEEFMNQPDDVLYFLYFSFVTMTTLGYGDISPITSYAMTATYLEAVFGQLYLAIMVARLVGMYIGERQKNQEIDSDPVV